MPTAMFGRFPEPSRSNNTLAADGAWYNREAPRLELKSLGRLCSYTHARDHWFSALE